VTEVAPGSDAANQGLTPGLVVLSINGQDVETRQDYCNAMQGVDSGELIPVVVGDTSTGRVVRARFTAE
jgi:S1-C subfamily serine protease